jgi:phospholipase/lecithinase/hemolysin
VIVFGDEWSLINPDGSKYTVNALESGSTTALNCAANPLWVQTLAAAYNLDFPQCPNALVNQSGQPPVSRMYAAHGAVIDDLQTQINAQISYDGFTTTDLVTVLVGANDVLAAFAQYPAVGEDQLDIGLDALGLTLASQVNNLAALGAKVIVSTVPDMGLTPFAGDRTPGASNGNPALLSRLTARLNNALLANLNDNGTEIGLIQLDEFLESTDAATQANRGTYANTTMVACTVALPKCTSNTLTPTSVGQTWLWADNLHVTPSGQANLASLALTRAQNNPF